MTTGAGDERWRRISGLYHAALDRDAKDRGTFLESACAGDESLRAEVESLLRYDDSDAVLPPVTLPEGAAPGRLVGRQLGSYEVRALLGAGGMGEVYAAYDPRLKRDVAIKVVPATLAAHPERLKRLEREARAAAALNHPNILAVYDIGMHEGVPFIVMERVPGETLADRVERGALPVSDALDVGIQIADALAAAHANGVVHRDLKPGNVMLTPEGRAKVLDFGLAKVLASDPPSARSETRESVATRPGQIFGTPAYMAPEQLLGRTSDHRADIYSLGVILYELVTGRRPFASDALLAAALRRLTQPAPNVIDVDASVPVAVSDVIAKCLATDPADRPASAATLKSELERLRSGLTPSGRVTPQRPRLSRVAIWVVAASVAAMAAVVGIARWGVPGATVTPPSRPIIAVLPLANLTGDPANDYIGIGIADALTTSLSRLSSVSVVSRETARDSARRTTEPSRLARELGVSLLVQGSLQRVGDRLRVDAKVIRDDGTIAVAVESEAAMSDLLTVERQLADRLVEVLRVAVSGAERRQLARSLTSSQEALEAYWRGVALLERTDVASVDQAIVSFQRAIALDANFALPHAGMGAAYVRKYSATNDKEWMTRAGDSVSRALEIDPAQTQVRLSLANVYRSTGRNVSAMAELRRVLDDEPTNDEARRRLGSIFESEGRYDEALEQFRRAVDDRPQYWLNHDLLGLFYYRTGRLQEAVGAFTRVTELRPESAQAFQRLGTTYQVLGDYQQARRNYERALQVAPDEGVRAAVYSNIGTMDYAEGRFEDAARAFSEAVQLFPRRALYRRNLGDVYLQLGREREARAEYETAVRLAEDALAVNPNDARTMAQLAVYEAKVGRRADAERHIERALVINPLPEVLFRRAAVLALHGDTKSALVALAEAVTKGYPVDVVRDDPDLAPLRLTPEFKALTASK